MNNKAKYPGGAHSVARRRVLVVGNTFHIPILPIDASILNCGSYDEARTALFRIQAGRDAPFDLAFIQHSLPDGSGSDLCKVFDHVNGGDARAVLTLP